MEELVKEFIKLLPDGFIPSREKLLIFIGAVRDEFGDQLTRTVLHQIVAIAQARDIPLNYFFPFSSAGLPISIFLNEDLEGLIASGLVEERRTIKLTKKGQEVVKIFKENSQAAKELFDKTERFAKELKEEIEEADLNVVEALRGVVIDSFRHIF